MKLDVNALKYLTKEEWRVLSAVELGQRNVRCFDCCSTGCRGLHLSNCSCPAAC